MDNGEKGFLYLEEGELELLVNISPAGSHGSQAEAETASVLDGLVAAVLHLKIETESSIKIFNKCLEPAVFPAVGQKISKCWVQHVTMNF